LTLVWSAQAQGAIMALNRVVSKIPMLITPQVGTNMGLAQRSSFDNT
jgi:hypothetical protein